MKRDICPAGEASDVHPQDLLSTAGAVFARGVNDAVGQASERASKLADAIVQGVYSAPKPVDEMPTRYRSYPIRGMGLHTRTVEEIRKAEKDGTPMHYDSYPPAASLEVVTDTISYLNDMWQEEWLSARELPEYVLRDRNALIDMGITLMPRLLGPNQCEEEGQVYWNVTKHDNYDPALMGCIKAKQLSSGKTFIEYWLSGFPDRRMFDNMIGEVEDGIILPIFARAFGGTKASTPNGESAGGREVTEESGESDTAEPTSAEDRAGDLDPLDRKIIEAVRRIEDEGLNATDNLVAARLPLNPKTNASYHRVTINKRRCKLRDRGYKV